MDSPCGGSDSKTISEKHEESDVLLSLSYKKLITDLEDALKQTDKKIEENKALKQDINELKEKITTYKKIILATSQELQCTEKLLVIAKKDSLLTKEELESSKKVIKQLSDQVLRNTLPPDKEVEQKTYQERKPVDESKSKPLDEDKPIMDISDKSQIMQEELAVQQSQLEKQKLELEKVMKQLEQENEQVPEIEELKLSFSYGSDVIKYQRDAAVQFSYMDHLDGVHVAGEILFFIQGDKVQSLNWEEYGFRLHFPQGTISPSDTCEVVVKALVGGNFQFPEGTELVSAVYAISFAKDVLKQVELEIEHCVYLKSSRQFKYLSFIIAPIVPPYKFQFLEGGKFHTKCQYGMITRSKFCLLGVVKKTDVDRVHTSSDEEEHIPSDSSDSDNGDTDSSSEDKNPNTTQTTSGDSGGHAKIQSTETTDSLPPEDKNLTSNTSDAMQTTFEHDTRKDISSDNQETHEEVKHKSVDDIEVREDISSDNQETHEEEKLYSGINTVTNDEISTLDFKTKQDKNAEYEVYKGCKQKCKSTGDLLYAGKIYYHCKGTNMWSSMFAVVKNLRVLQKYMRSKHPCAEEGNTVSFCFKDQDKGFVGLDFERKKMSCCRGWVVKPMDVDKKLLKEKVDCFGSRELVNSEGDPPSYWITVYAEKTDVTETSMKCLIPLTGVKREKEICIVRHMEYDTESIIAFEPQKQLKQIITDELKRNFAEHGKLSQESVSILAKEMVDGHMISRVVAKKPNIDVLINHFLADLEIIEEVDEIRDYFETFLSLFDRLDGKSRDIADKIKKNIAAFNFE